MRALSLHYQLYFHSKFVRHLSARKRKNETLLYWLFLSRFSLRMESSKSIQMISRRNYLLRLWTKSWCVAQSNKRCWTILSYRIAYYRILFLQTWGSCLTYIFSKHFVVVVLIHQAIGFQLEILFRTVRPPIFRVSIFIKQSSWNGKFIIKRYWAPLWWYTMVGVYNHQIFSLARDWA